MIKEFFAKLRSRRGMRIYTPTGGSRMATWFFPIFTIVIGLIYMFQPEARSSSPAFEYARHIAPVRVWGMVFVAIGVWKVVALLRRNAFDYSLAMCAAAGLYFMWAVFFLASSFADDTVSFAAPLWPIYVCFFHIAMVSTVSGKR